jgi:DNA polymerase
MLSADYSAIEARVLAWLAGEEWRLEVFRTHGQIYEAGACAMFGLTMQEFWDHKKRTGKHHPMRKKGKLGELSCGYMGSVNALIQFGALREGLTEPELQPIVDRWRAANPNIKKYWFASEDAAVEAVRNPGTWFPVGKVSYGVFAAAGARYLFCRLPSGRRLAYRNPEIRQVEIWTKKSEETGKPWIKDAVFYYGQLPTPGGTKSQVWGMVPLSPGILVENQVQAISFDLMANGTLVAARKGYRIYSLIHDEAMSAWDDRATQSIEDFQRCLESAPAWADGLPLGTSGEVVPYYRK